MKHQQLGHPTAAAVLQVAPLRSLLLGRSPVFCCTGRVASCPNHQQAVNNLFGQSLAFIYNRTEIILKK